MAIVWPLPWRFLVCWLVSKKNSPHLNDCLYFLIKLFLFVCAAHGHNFYLCIYYLCTCFYGCIYCIIVVHSWMDPATNSTRNNRKRQTLCPNQATRAAEDHAGEDSIAFKRGAVFASSHLPNMGGKVSCGYTSRPCNYQ